MAVTETFLKSKASISLKKFDENGDPVFDKNGLQVLIKKSIPGNVKKTATADQVAAVASACGRLLEGSGEDGANVLYAFQVTENRLQG